MCGWLLYWRSQSDSDVSEGDELLNKTEQRRSSKSGIFNIYVHKVSKFALERQDSCRCLSNAETMVTCSDILVTKTKTNQIS